MLMDYKYLQFKITECKDYELLWETFVCLFVVIVLVFVGGFFVWYWDRFPCLKYKKCENCPAKTISISLDVVIFLFL